MVEALNAFVASAISTLRDTMQVDATVDCTVSPGGPRPRFVVDVGVTGDLRSVTWVFPVEIARELARQMVGTDEEEVQGFAAMDLENVQEDPTRPTSALGGRKSDTCAAGARHRSPHTRRNRAAAARSRQGDALTA
jgi:hypothetical protein